MATVSCEALSKEKSLDIKKPPYIPKMFNNNTYGARSIISSRLNGLQSPFLSAKKIFIEKTSNNKSGRIIFKGFSKKSATDFLCALIIRPKNAGKITNVKICTKLSENDNVIVFSPCKKNVIASPMKKEWKTDLTNY